MQVRRFRQAVRHQNIAILLDLPNGRVCQAVKDGRYDLPKATGGLSMTAKRLLVWVLRMTG